MSYPPNDIDYINPIIASSTFIKYLYSNELNLFLSAKTGSINIFSCSY